jgi:hypothetical protein
LEVIAGLIPYRCFQGNFLGRPDLCGFDTFRGLHRRDGDERRQKRRDEI